MTTKKTAKKQPVKAAEAKASAAEAAVVIVDDLDNDYQNDGVTAEKNPSQESEVLTPTSPDEIENSAEEAATENTETPEPVTPKERVEVIYNGTVGHLGLKTGAVTDHADYIALAKTPRGARYLRLLTE